MVNKKISLLVFSLMFLVLLMGNVSAMEIDNVRSYNPTTRTVTIKNSFLWVPTSEIATVQLITPLNVKVPRGYQQVAEIKIEGFEDYKDFINQLEFYDLKNNKGKISRDYDLKLRGSEVVDVDDYTSIKTGESTNGTGIYSYEVTGTHEETKTTWKKLTPADIKKNDVLYIGIFTDVQAGDFVDWVPTIAGVKVPEWASWESSLNVDLEHYYKLDGTSGEVIDSLGTSDGTNNGATPNVTGIINTAYDFDGTDDYIDTTYSVSGLTNFSIGLWANWDNTDTGNVIISNDDAGFDSSFRIRSNSGKISFNVQDGGSTQTDVDSLTTISTGMWYHCVYVKEGTNHKLYVNAGTPASTTLAQTPNSNNLYIGKRIATTYDEPMDGKIDEVGIWNRALTPTEITELYNSGDGLGLNSTGDLPPTITLNSPDSSNYTTPQSLNINFTASDDINLSDVKLYVNGILNATNASGINNSVYLFPLTLGDGNYTIYGTATDNESQQTNSSSIDIFIDTINPVLTVTSPVVNYTTFSLPLGVNLSVVSSDLNLNKCWYSHSDNLTNVTYTCNTNVNVSFSTGGTKNIYLYANDSLGNEETTTATTSINYVTEDARFSATVVEEETNLIVLNINATNIDTFNATLHYNGTDYSGIVLTNPGVPDRADVGFTLTAPSLDANELVYFNFTYTLNGVDYNSSTYNQTLVFLTPIEFSASCVDKTLRFDLQDEGNLSAIYGNMEYNFKYGLTNGSLKEVFGSLTNVTTAYLCINATVSENYTIDYGEIQYRSSGYVDRRYYLFEGQTISNNTLTNHTLRDLVSADQTSFLITMEDTSLNSYTEKYTALWRWYPDLNKYQIVEMGKTDDDGQTVSHVNTEDTDYRIGLYELDGTLITLDNPRRFVCTSAPCSLTVRVGATDVDYSSLFDVQASLTYVSDVFTLIYNDPNQYTSGMRLYVTRETGSSTLVICNDTSTGFTGVISCNTSAYTGLKKAVVYRSASPEVIILQKAVSELNTTFNSGFGLFISMFLWLAIVLTGFAVNPIFTIILGVVGLIPALLLGSVNLTIFTGIAVLGALVIHLIKRSVA